MYEIRVEKWFSASHQLRMYDGSLEPLHGHNWRVRVTVAAPELDGIGVVMDFHVLARQLDAAISPWHNGHLNDHPAFARVNPSAENVAGTVAGAIAPPEGVELTCVEVWETRDCAAVYRPDAGGRREMGRRKSPLNVV